VLTGIAFRPELAGWLATRPREVGCVEMRVDQAAVALRASRPERGHPRPVVLNAPRLSVGRHGPLNPSDICDAMRAASAADAIWITAYLGCCRRPEVDFSYPDPVPTTRAALGHAIVNCRQIMEVCGRPLLVENVAAFRRVEESISEAQFINQLCDETGCGLLVDVTALTLDARFGFKCREWLWDVDPRHIVALHVGGWRHGGAGRWEGRREGRVSEEVWTLASEVAARASIRAAILQRDGSSLGFADIRADLHGLAALDSVRSLPQNRAEAALAAS
jgi:uncharacterized protein (UPF0276 family)